MSRGQPWLPLEFGSDPGTLVDKVTVLFVFRGELSQYLEELCREIFGAPDARELTTVVIINK